MEFTMDDKARKDEREPAEAVVKVDEAQQLNDKVDMLMLQSLSENDDVYRRLVQK